MAARMNGHCQAGAGEGGGQSKEGGGKVEAGEKKEKARSSQGPRQELENNAVGGRRAFSDAFRLRGSRGWVPGESNFAEFRSGEPLPGGLLI